MGVKISTSSPTQKEFISAVATDLISISHSRVTVPRNSSHDLLVDVVYTIYTAGFTFFRYIK